MSSMLARLRSAAAPLVTFATFCGLLAAQVWLDYADVGEIATGLGDARALWVVQVHRYLDGAARLMGAVCIFLLVDHLTAPWLDPRRMVMDEREPPAVRAAVILGWCIALSAFVLALS